MTIPDASREVSADGTSGVTRDDRVDAVRYAVLRKLAPGLRHALMGELQAIALSSELAARMLRAHADLAEVRDNIDHIPQQCTAAGKAARAVIELLGSEEGNTVPVGDGVRQCLKLAGEDWFLRGIEATTQLPDMDIQLPKRAFQELLVTALLVLTDMYDRPIDLQVIVRLVGGRVDVVVQAQESERTATLPRLGRYRKLVWADLELLARTHGIPCVCEGAITSLRFQPIDQPQGAV